MVPINLLLEVNIFLYSYLFIYNLSIILFFWLLFSTLLVNLKTLNTFNSLSFSFYYVLALTVIILSIAGVPPFIGFFSKLFLLLLITNNSFFILYPILFTVLFTGLYFYVQNVRFIHSTNLVSTSTPHLTHERHSLPFFYALNTALFLVSLGLFYIDDVVLVWVWVLL